MPWRGRLRGQYLGCFADKHRRELRLIDSDGGIFDLLGFGLMAIERQLGTGTVRRALMCSG